MWVPALLPGCKGEEEEREREDRDRKEAGGRETGADTGDVCSSPCGQTIHRCQFPRSLKAQRGEASPQSEAGRARERHTKVCVASVCRPQPYLYPTQAARGNVVGIVVQGRACWVPATHRARRAALETPQSCRSPFLLIYIKQIKFAG